VSARPLTAPKKKMWVQPESREVETEGKDRKSSDDESPASRRSPVSVISGGRVMAPEYEVPLHLREPRAFGDRTNRTHVRFNHRTGRRNVRGKMRGGNEILTGGGDGETDLRVRRVTAGSWLEGYGSNEDDGVEDIDDQLYRIIDSTPAPWTISRALRIAIQRYPQRAP